MAGLATAAAVHLLALAALLPEARPNDPASSHPSDADAPVVEVQLVRLRPPAARATVQPQPEDAPRTRTASLPEEDAPFEVALSAPDSPGLSAPTRPEDDEALYRVPFRDAVAQADARLRAGLGCAHVDLDQLPQSVLDLCDEVARFRNAAQPRGLKRGPLG